MDCYVNRSVEVAMPDEPKISPCPVCGKRCKGDGFSFTIDCTWCAYRVSSPATHERICTAMNRDNHALAEKIGLSLAENNMLAGDRPSDVTRIVAVIEAALEGAR